MLSLDILGPCTIVVHRDASTSEQHIFAGGGNENNPQVEKESAPLVQANVS